MVEQQFLQFVKSVDGYGISGTDTDDSIDDKSGYGLGCNINADQAHPLILAYIGDSVYEMFIRTRLLNSIQTNVNRIHRAAVDYVRAASQADIAHYIFEDLTEKEADIVRRARNAKSGYVPKNADVVEYRYATGFEALVGYLYLKHELKRLFEILNAAACRVESRNAANAVKCN